MRKPVDVLAPTRPARPLLSVSIRQEARAALRELVAASNLYPWQIVSDLLQYAGRALRRGLTFDEIILALASPPHPTPPTPPAPVARPDQAPVGLPGQAARSPQSPTADTSRSVTQNVTDRPTDRPCGGGFA